ncbi:MAG: glycosyltransferase family 4 protein [Chloroflexi bacterium]|nr:glycosyltransferase family 4 protein [Chloroflexota bacterium]
MLAPTPFFGDYGCHVRIFEESLSLQSYGARITICSYHAGRDIPGVRIERSADVPWSRGVQIGSSRHKPYLDVLLGARALATTLHQRPQIVHGHLHEGAFIGLPLARLFRVPLVFDFQGSMTSEMVDHNFLSPTSRLFRPFYQLERLVNHKADAIITSTRHGADLLVRDFGCSSRKIYPVPDAVNPATFVPRWEVSELRRTRLRRALGIPSGRKLVVYLGLLAEYQGCSYLLQAAAQLLRRRTDVHFVLMGYPGEERYRRLAAQLDIARHVTLTGRVPYEHAPAYLSIGDIAVSPKVSATEGNGKLLNYMAVGLPTVTFDTPVAREILGELGVRVPVGDVGALARAIELLIGDEALAADLGQRLRARAVERFSWHAAGAQVLDVYDRVLR